MVVVRRRRRDPPLWPLGPTPWPVCGRGPGAMHDTSATTPHRNRCNARLFRPIFASVDALDTITKRYPRGRRRKTAAASAATTTRAASATSNRPTLRDAVPIRASDVASLERWRQCTSVLPRLRRQAPHASRSRPLDHGNMATPTCRALVAWLQHGVHPPVALAPRWAR